MLRLSLHRSLDGDCVEMGIWDIYKKMKTAGFKACNLPYPKYWKHYYGVLERQQDMQPGVAWFMEPIWERFSVSWLENKMEMMICFRAV